MATDLLLQAVLTQEPIWSWTYDVHAEISKVCRRGLQKIEYSMPWETFWSDQMPDLLKCGIHTFTSLCSPWTFRVDFTIKQPDRVKHSCFQTKLLYWKHLLLYFLKLRTFGFYFKAIKPIAIQCSTGTTGFENLTMATLWLVICRVDIGGKTGKTRVLPGFCKLECGTGSGATPPCNRGLIWLGLACCAGGAPDLH